MINKYKVESAEGRSPQLRAEAGGSSALPVKLEARIDSARVELPAVASQQPDFAARSTITENPSPVLRIAKDKTVLYSNKAGVSLLSSLKSKIGKAAPKRWNHSIENAFKCQGSLTIEEEIDGQAFSIFITAIRGAGYVNLYASDITELKKTEKMLLESRADLGEQKLAVERKNIALREIIEQVEIEKNKIKDDVITNVNELALPIVRKLRAKGVIRKYADLLSNRLEKLTSSLGRMLTGNMLKLTPKEIEICNMTEGGLASKEIADFLNVSRQTIEKHRKNIRKKLNIDHKSINLTTYLQKRLEAQA